MRDAKGQKGGEVMRMVEVVDYDFRWPVQFRVEAEKIKGILGAELVEIFHIGSTTVENLRAKPIIDIMPVVKDICAVDCFKGQFEAIGYEALGEYGMAGRRFFRKGPETRSYHVHVYEDGNRHDIERHLAVRDFLRKHPAEANKYGQLKKELAAFFPFDVGAYVNGKDSFVKALEKRAVEWYLARKAGSIDSGGKDG